VAIQFVHLPGMASLRVGRLALRRRIRPQRRQPRPGHERAQECRERRLGPVGPGAVAARDEFDARRRTHALDQRQGAVHFAADIVDLWRDEPAGPAARARRHHQLGSLGGFNDERTRGDHRRQLRVSKLLQQPEHVPIDRLLPHVLPRVEVAAHADGVDPRVQGAGIESQQPAFAPADHPDVALDAGILAQPSHRSNDLLDLIADQVPPHLERRSVQELAIRELAVGHVTVDECGHDNHAATFRKPPRELAVRWYALRQAGKHLRHLICVGNRDDEHPGGLVCDGKQDQAFSMDIAERPPANPEGLESRALVQCQALGYRADDLEGRFVASQVAGAEDVG